MRSFVFWIWVVLSVIWISSVTYFAATVESAGKVAGSYSWPVMAGWFALAVGPAVVSFALGLAFFWALPLFGRGFGWALGLGAFLVNRGASLANQGIDTGVYIASKKVQRQARRASESLDEEEGQAMESGRQEPHMRAPGHDQ